MEVTHASPVSDAIVQVQDVFKIYGTNGEQTVALRGAHLTVGNGEFLALLGRSGSGKSTLLQIIAGLDTPSAGRVVVNGRDIAQLDEQQRADIRQKTIGLVLQRDNLVPYLTALENAALPLQLSGLPQAEQTAESLLHRVGLKDRTRHRVSQLSGGEAQRVSVAVALAHHPRLLIGDEVTGELDGATASSLLDLLWELHEQDGMSLLIVTHDDAVAERAERVVYMRDGLVGGRS